MHIENIEETIVECCKRISDAMQAQAEAKEMFKKVRYMANKRGGLGEMERAVNTLQQEYIGKETKAGNAYRIRPICNDAWHGIGNWIR